MITRIDKETVQFICKHKLTFQQFALCLLIYHKEAALIEQINEEVGYIGDCLIPLGKGDYIRELKDLVDKKYLIDNNKENDYHLDNYILTPKFKNEFLVDLANAPQEAWSKYPKFLLFNTQEITTKSCIYDEFAALYLKSINYSIEEHKKALEDIDFIKKKSQYAQVKIMNWAGGRLWNERSDTTIHKSKIV